MKKNSKRRTRKKERWMKEMPHRLLRVLGCMKVQSLMPFALSFSLFSSLTSGQRLEIMNDSKLYSRPGCCSCLSCDVIQWENWTADFRGVSEEVRVSDPEMRDQSERTARLPSIAWKRTGYMCVTQGSKCLISLFSCKATPAFNSTDSNTWRNRMRKRLIGSI